MNEKLITLQEAASLLDLTTTTLRNWDKIGRLRAVRNPSNKYRFYRLDDVMRMRNQAPLFEMKETRQGIGDQGTADTSMTSYEVHSLIRAMHRVIRDYEGNSSLMERFDELTKVLYCKIYDEEKSANGSQSMFKELPKIEERLASDRILALFQELVMKRKDLFPDRFSTLRLKRNTLSKLGQILSQKNLSSAYHDLKGIAYEEMIKDTFDKGDNQQYLTPLTVVEFMVGMLKDKLCGTICDPACGTGRFLVETQKQSGMKIRLLGFEIDDRLAWVSRINLDMHNSTSFEILYIPQTGSLGRDLGKYFGKEDVVITNPPFGSDFSDEESLSKFELGLNRSSRRRGVLFVERALDLVKPGGFIAIIIDDSVLNGQTNMDVRELILKRARLLGVISLPDTTFMPYASVKASIVILQKYGTKKDSQSKTFFAEAEYVGKKPNGDALFKADKPMELLSDLPEILMSWESSQNDESQNGLKWFRTEIPSLDDEIFRKDGYRLDIPYHHPSRMRALKTLMNSTFPLMELKSICSERNEAVVPSNDLQDEQIFFVGLANIEPHTGVCKPVLVNASSIKSTLKRFVSGDILFAKMRPGLRKVCIVRDGLGEGFASSECIVLVPKLSNDVQPYVIPKLLELLLRSDLVFGQLMHMVNGIGRPRLGKSVVLNAKIPVPPYSEQVALLEAFESSQAKANTLMKKSDACLKQAKLIVKNAQKELLSTLLNNED